MIAPNELISIGSIRRTHGKNGELQCHTTNTLWEDSEAEFMFLLIDAIPVPFRVTDWRTKGTEDLIVRFKGVDTEPAATRLVGCEAFMLRKDIANETDEGLVTWQDLAGRQLIDTEQGKLGIIRSVDETTANTLVELENGQLLPLHEDFIIEITDNSLVVRFPFQL